jgi:hypothetical protein
VRAASAARTVERGKNPEDGTGGGLATLTFPAAAARPWWGETGHPASLRSREQEPQERRNPGSPGVTAAQADAATPEARAAETRSGSEREANSRRGSSGTSVTGVRLVEEHPEAVSKRRGGSAGSHEGATRPTSRELEHRQMIDGWG